MFPNDERLNPPNNERLIGIAVSSKLSPDALMVMEGWLHGRRWSVYNEESTLRSDHVDNVIFYWDRARNFTKVELDALNLYLERFFELDDPKPYLCDMVRSSEYLYAGSHKEKSHE